MKDLHVFCYRDCDFVVAHDLEDAWACLEEQTGEGFRGDGGIENWERLPGDRMLTIWCEADGDVAQVDEDGAEPVERTCAEWAARNGRGFLCSTET